MKDSPIDFSRKLIKGRVTETLFEQMFRDAGGFTVLAFGYENLLPELAHQQQNIVAIDETMEIIRRAPDFAVINNTTHEVQLIEVKYRMHPTPENNYRSAQRMFKSWKPFYLFLATPKGFFFGKVSTIIDQKGVIPPLGHKHVPSELQDKYKELLNEFIPPHEELNEEST